MKLIWLAATIAATVVPVREKEVSIYPALDKDRRLRAVITMDYPHEKLGQVVAALHKQLGVNLAVEGDLLERTVSLSLKGREGRFVLTDIGILLHGCWIKRGAEDYLLVQNEHDGHLAQIDNPARIHDCSQQLAQSLQQQQWASLYVNKRLHVTQLSVAQRRLFQTALFQRYFEAPERYRRAVLVGNDGGVIYIPPGNGQNNHGAIGLWAPDVEGQPEPFGLIPIP
jgi:hypothetical protein